MSEQRLAIYNEARIPVAEGDSVSAVKDQLARFYPELRNAEGYIDEENNIRFRVTGGTKGN